MPCVVSQQMLLGGQSDWCKTGTRHRVTTEDEFGENDSRFLCLLESFKTADSAAGSRTHFTCIGVFVHANVCELVCSLVSVYTPLIWFWSSIKIFIIVVIQSDSHVYILQHNMLNLCADTTLLVFVGALPWTQTHLSFIIYQREWFLSLSRCFNTFHTKRNPGT